MATGWCIAFVCCFVLGWMAWVHFWVAVAPKRGWWWGDGWRPRVAEVRIALDAWAGSYRGKRCIKCGSTDVQVAQSGLWDGFDANGARTGGSFWYGECHACRCRMASEDDNFPAREVEEEEWIHTICAPY